MTIDEIIENFALLDEWDDRYRYVIERPIACPAQRAGSQTQQGAGLR
jgi:sulfur transfer protein SufE